MEREIKISNVRHGSRKENIVAPPVSPETIAMNGTMQHSREIKTVITANAIELLKVFIREGFKGAVFRPFCFTFSLSNNLLFHLCKDSQPFLFSDSFE